MDIEGRDVPLVVHKQELREECLSFADQLLHPFPKPGDLDLRAVEVDTATFDGNHHRGPTAAGGRARV